MSRSLSYVLFDPYKIPPTQPITGLFFNINSEQTFVLTFTFNVFCLSNLSILNVPDEGYCRNLSLNMISTPWLFFCYYNVMIGWLGLVCMVFSVTFNNISVISWRSTTILSQVTDKLYGQEFYIGEFKNKSCQQSFLGLKEVKVSDLCIYMLLTTKIF